MLVRASDWLVRWKDGRMEGKSAENPAGDVSIDVIFIPEMAAYVDLFGKIVPVVDVLCASGTLFPIIT